MTRYLNLSDWSGTETSINLGHPADFNAFLQPAAFLKPNSVKKQYVKLK